MRQRNYQQLQEGSRREDGQEEHEEEEEPEDERFDPNPTISHENPSFPTGTPPLDSIRIASLSHTTSSAARIMADNLMNVLRRAKANDLSMVDLERKRLPSSYLRALLKALVGNTTIRRIRLYKVGLTDVHAQQIAELLCGCHHLVDLDLAKNDFTNAGVLGLADAIPQCRSLRRLVLAGHAVSGSALVALTHAIAVHPTLQSVKLSQARFETVETRIALEQLLLRENSALCRLDLRHCGMHAHMDIVAQALSSTHHSLVGLCLAENQLEDHHVELLADALQYNTSLQILDLQRNDRLHQIDSLLDCLQGHNHTLQKLKLRHCHGIPIESKELLLDLLLMNAHGADLAVRTKRAERRILEHSMPDLSETSYDEDESSSSCDSDSSFDMDCVICFERCVSTVVLLPCGHHNCCAECGSKLRTCHMCRETVVKVFSTAAMVP